MRRAWPVLLFLILVLIVLLNRPRGTSTAPASAPPRPAALRSPSDERGLATADAEARKATAQAVEASVPPETRDACLASLVWLLTTQNADGSWGEGPARLEGALVGRPGLTGLALLAFLGAGYSHLSKDTYEGRVVGDGVREGLKALMADLREDGSFRSASGSLDQAIGAQALSEAYGLTGSNLFKDQAQASIRALAALQAQDGSWGDPTTTYWALDALKSAEISGLEFPKAAYDGVRAYYDRWGTLGDPRELFARIFIEKSRLFPSYAPTAAALAASPPGPSRPIYDLYLESRAVFQADGPSGPLWKSWNEPFKRSLLPRFGPDGSVAGAGLSDTVLRTSLGTLALEIYYRYAAVPDSR